MSNQTELLDPPTTSAATSAPAGFPEMPAPMAQHAWLEKFVGQWKSQAVISCDPTQPALHCTGVETARMVGGFWLVADGRSEMSGAPFESRLTLGYNPATQKYIGSWIDSMTSHLWQYEGELDAAGTILTLHSEAACPANPGQISLFKEVTEFKSADHRIFTSSRQEADGSWNTMVTVNYHRVS